MPGRVNSIEGLINSTAGGANSGAGKVNDQAKEGNGGKGALDSIERVKNYSGNIRNRCAY